ncbi:MAG: Npun_F5749 family FMN-dependent PPOX-type flavoprotein [Cyanobacteria bacterium J06626_18]
MSSSIARSNASEERKRLSYLSPWEYGQLLNPKSFVVKAKPFTLSYVVGRSLPLSLFMSLAPWRPVLSRALHRNRSRVYSRYPQLATVRPNGRPANRTVVFREFLPETNQLIFITDCRSEKISHLTENPAAELCWYFTQTREQFRLGGQIQIVIASTPNESLRQVHQHTWEALSAKARQQFAWPHPGKPRATKGFEETILDPQHPLNTFAVLIFDPDTIDHLELKGEPQNRHYYQRQADGAWEVTEVNP